MHLHVYVSIIDVHLKSPTQFELMHAHTHTQAHIHTNTYIHTLSQTNTHARVIIIT